MLNVVLVFRPPATKEHSWCLLTEKINVKEKKHRMSWPIDSHVQHGRSLLLKLEGLRKEIHHMYEYRLLRSLRTHQKHGYVGNPMLQDLILKNPTHLLRGDGLQASLHQLGVNNWPHLSDPQNL